MVLAHTHMKSTLTIYRVSTQSLQLNAVFVLWVGLYSFVLPDYYYSTFSLDCWPVQLVHTI